MLFDPLLALLLTCHLLSVNIASAAPLAMIVLDRRASRGDRSAAELLTKVGFLAFKALLVGGLLGVLYGLRYWSDDYAAVILATGNRWKFTIAEYFFSLLLVAIVWVLTKRAYSKARLADESFSGASFGGFLVRAFLLFAAGTNLLYHFPIFFQVIAHLRSGPLPAEPLDSAAFRALMAEPSIAYRSLHVILASFASVGAMIAWMCGLRWKRADAERQTGWLRWYRFGLHLAVWPTVAQLFVGFAVVTVLSSAAQNRLAFGSIPGVLSVVASLITLVGLTYAMILGLAERDRASRGGAIVLWMSAVIWSMCWMSLAAG
ncbi:MAG TPA: hypothetical protein DCQ98_19790 [Planctomycetaceae bacterium]|nr:hypothetical protein [Planctomycetaceae bacterium]